MQTWRSITTSETAMNYTLSRSWVGESYRNTQSTGPRSDDVPYRVAEMDIDMVLDEWVGPLVRT